MAERIPEASGPRFEMPGNLFWANWVLEIDAGDPGCELVFETLDEYIDAVARGNDVTAKYQQVLTHLEACGACREDAEGLLAAIHEGERSTFGK